MSQAIDNLAVNTLRVLSAEMVQQANSGHPGLPLGAAPAAFALWSRHLKHNPENPNWVDRDRFVLSAGHGSALLYSLLYLFGYGLQIDDLKSFRQWDSLTPGHPEYKHTPGVEITTGPLGQGFASAVVMAIAERHLTAKFNKPDYNIVDHYTFVLCGDGCLMEGVTSEAASLAGTFKLGKLIVLYDSNSITIEGSTDITFTEDVVKRFQAYGWQTIVVEDGNDLSKISDAIELAKSDIDHPSIIQIKTQIGYGAPNKQGKACAHGEPLGLEEIAAMKKNLGMQDVESFYVSEEVKKYIVGIKQKLSNYEMAWSKLFDSYKKKYPSLADEWAKWYSGKVDLEGIENLWECPKEDLATRSSSEFVLNKLSDYVPNLFGGAADLAPSTKSVMKNREFFSPENLLGSNFHFGVREHAMAAIANGLALHGGLRAYVSGFFVFSDYMKPSMRLASLMGLPVIYVLTHDSIGVGEDGPTHQPVEHLAALRSIPNFTVIRPCDTRETIAAWYYALNNNFGPTALILSRQKLPLLPKTGVEALKGAYVLKDSKDFNVILLATGSEVDLACKVYDRLLDEGIGVRVVSMPSFEIFERQAEEYKESVLPKNVRNRIAIEAGASFGWHKYIGIDGEVVTVDSFGASAPSDVLFEKFGFEVENIVGIAKRLLGL